MVYLEINWHESNKQICINHRVKKGLSWFFFFWKFRYSLIHLNEMQMGSTRRPLRNENFPPNVGNLFEFVSFLFVCP